MTRPGWMSFTKRCLAMKFHNIQHAKAVARWQCEVVSAICTEMVITASGSPANEPNKRESIYCSTELWYPKEMLTPEKIEQLQQGLEIDISSLDLEELSWQVNVSVIRGPRLFNCIG